MVAFSFSEFKLPHYNKNIIKMNQRFSHNLFFQEQYPYHVYTESIHIPF